MTVIAVTAAEVTVTEIVPDTKPEVAVRTAVPGPVAVALPVLKLMEITPELLDVHVAPATTLLVPSENFPVAVNGTVAPRGIGGKLLGPMERLCSTGVPTLRGIDGETTAPREAEIAVVAYPTPAATAVALGVGLVPGAAVSETSQTSRTM